MGKIKEALLIGEEIKEHLAQTLGEDALLGTRLGMKPYPIKNFNILKFCGDRDLSPEQALKQIYLLDEPGLRSLLG